MTNLPKSFKFEVYVKSDMLIIIWMNEHMHTLKKYIELRK